MTNIAANIDAEVASYRSWIGVEWLRGAQQFPAGRDDVSSLPNHAVHWSRGGVLDQAGEEWLLLEIGVVLFEHGFAWLAELHRHKFEATLLELLDDFPDQVSLDAIWLNHYVSPLHLWGRFGLGFTALAFLALLLCWLLLFFASFLSLLVLFRFGGVQGCYLRVGEENLISSVEVDSRL